MNACDAFQRNWTGLFELLPTYESLARCWREDNVLIGISGWPIGAFNAAIFDDEFAINAAQVASLTTLFHRLGLPYSMQMCSPKTIPACDQIMREQGYTCWFADPLLICEGPLHVSSSNPAIEIVDVSEENHLDDYRRIVEQVFELPVQQMNGYLDTLLFIPESQQVVAKINGQAVGSGMLLCCNGIAAIYELGTLPHVRHQGIGTALVAALHQRALTAGYSGTVLASSAMGLSLYSRLGYRLDGYQIAYNQG